MASKRGLSEVVTAVILILLVLAAIAILWSFLRPTIQGAAEQASAACVTLDVEVTGCNATTSDVVVKRNVGSGELTAVKLIMDDGAKVQEFPTTMAELSSSTFDFTANATALTANNKFTVAAVTAQGTCNPVSEAVACKL